MSARRCVLTRSHAECTPLSGIIYCIIIAIILICATAVGHLNIQASRNIQIRRLLRRKLDHVVLSSTAVYTLCTLFEFCTAAHAFLNGLFFAYILLVEYF